MRSEISSWVESATALSFCFRSRLLQAKWRQICPETLVFPKFVFMAQINSDHIQRAPKLEIVTSLLAQVRRSLMN